MRHFIVGETRPKKYNRETSIAKSANLWPHCCVVELRAAICTCFTYDFVKGVDLKLLLAFAQDTGDVFSCNEVVPYEFQIQTLLFAADWRHTYNML